MGGTFHIIDRSNWERNIYFDYYFDRIKCKYNLNANIDISEILKLKREHGFRFFPMMLYAIMRGVNMNKEFRMSFDTEGNLGYWDEVVASYTVFHEDDHTFSDIWSEYSNDFHTFYNTVVSDIDTYKDIRGVIKARPCQPSNYCPVSCVPWLSFTGFAQDTYSESQLLFPLIRFGKFFECDNKFMLPFSISVNHAVADGYHTCKLINDISSLSASAKDWM